MTEAVIWAVPGLTALTAIGAEMAPAGTMTVAGTVATAASTVANAIVVSTSCATLMVTVRLPVAPCCSGSGLGSSDTIAAGCGATWTVEVFEVLFAVAVISASPVESAVAVNVALVAPWATVTEAGTPSTELEEDSSTSVLVVCAELRRTVKVLVAPTFMV